MSQAQTTACPVIEGLMGVRLMADDAEHPAIDAAVAEIIRLRRGWLRVIQAENSCPATGGGCFAKRCGCVAEMEMLANE